MRALLQPNKLFSNKFRAGECVCGILGCCIMKQMPRNLTTSFFFVRTTNTERLALKSDCIVKTGFQIFDDGINSINKAV